MIYFYGTHSIHAKSHRLAFLKAKTCIHVIREYLYSNRAMGTREPNHTLGRLRFGSHSELHPGAEIIPTKNPTIHGM